MSTIAYDSQSLMVDGRRLWLVTAAFDYTRTPRLLWRHRLHRLRSQGFNAVAIAIPWRLHEPRQHRFDFTGQRDLRHLLQTVRDLGLYAILKPGPYVGAAFEAGGLPAWLRALPDIRLRESSRPYLDACARWLAAFMEQVRDLQVANERSALIPHTGPVLLIQVEHDWRCQNDGQAAGHLRELTRYLREGGCQVPLIEANNGWQTIESTFSTWRGSDDLASTMRQFRAVQLMPPAQHFPLLVGEVKVQADEKHAAADGVAVAQALAVGAQVELDIASSEDPLQQPPVLPGCVRQLITFSQQFSQLFAHLHADRHHVAIAPQGDDHELTLLHQHGTQGDVVFLIRSERDKSRTADLLLPDGRSMRVEMGEDRVAWAAFNVNLAGVATLDHTNLRPLAFIDNRLLVLTGPAGGAGTLSIDGAPIDVTVPRGNVPTVVRTDALTVAILSARQADGCAIVANGLHLGVAGVDENDQPLPHRAFKQAALLHSDGRMSKITPKTAAKSPAPPRLGPWTTADAAALIDGNSEAYREVAPGSGLSALAPGDRMGFYRINLPASRLGSNLLAPHWADRALLFHQGRLIAQLPAKGNATMSEPFTLKAASQLTLLASHDGHARDGWRLDECKGLAGHLYQVKPIKLARAGRTEMRLPDATAWRSFLCDVSHHVRPTVTAWSWTLKPAGRHGIIITIDDLPCRVLVLANGSVVGGYDPIESDGRVTITLHHGRQITGGRNRIDLVPMENDDRLAKLDPRKFVRCYDAIANLTAKAAWSFAPLTLPDDGQFTPIKRNAARGLPAWFRTAFATPSAAIPLHAELSGLSNAQAWLNGHPLGGVTSEAPLHLPHEWLSQDAKKPNTLTIFDERGCQPRSCRLRFEA